jgi:hypothetical protein
MLVLKLNLVGGQLLFALVAALLPLQPLHHRLATDAAIPFSDEILEQHVPELHPPSADGSNVIVQLQSR